MASNKVVIDQSQFKRMKTLLTGLGDKREIQKTIATSIRRTLPSVRKIAVSGMKSKKMITNIDADGYKRKIRSFLNVGGSKSAKEQYGKVWMTSYGESLARFITQVTAIPRKGANIKPGGKPNFAFTLNSWGRPYLKNPERSFLVQKHGGNILFARVGSKRLPIEKLKGPSVSDLIQQGGILPLMVTQARTRYEKEFKQNLEYFTGRAIRGAKGAK